MMSAGQNFSLGIKTDGTLWGWGLNSNQLGLGFSGNQNLPIQIGVANDWITVSAGSVHSLAIKTNGTLWSWGNGQFGQLGNGIFNSATWNVTQVGSATDWIQCSAGNRFSLAIKNTGTLWSFGLNNTGQLGLGNIIDQNLPVQVGTANNWFKIDAGDQHSLAIDTSGFLYAWGNNSFGQLGNGTFTTSLIPILISTSNIWSEVSAGFDHSLFLNGIGFIFSCGNNTNGQLCNGSNTASNVIIPATNSGAQFLYIAISAGAGHSLAIENNNTLWSSGLNVQGQLGLGNNTNTNVLTQVGSSNTWFAISAGDVHSLALETTTSLSSVGRNQEGQLGIGNNVFSYNTLQSVGCPTTPLSNQEFTLNLIKAYPNPTNNSVNIDYNLENSSSVILRLTNIQGQIISETKADRSNGLQSDTIDLSNESSGMYFLTITSENSSQTTKIIKQ